MVRYSAAWSLQSAVEHSITSQRRDPTGRRNDRGEHGEARRVGLTADRADGRGCKGSGERCLGDRQRRQDDVGHGGERAVLTLRDRVAAGNVHASGFAEGLFVDGGFHGGVIR